MYRINKPSDKPHAPMAIDIQIGLHRGSTAALEATPERLQATKKLSPPSTAERIEELTRENGRLRLEIRYYQRMRDVTQELFDDTKFVVGRLSTTITRFTQVQREAENDWCDAQA